MTATNQNVEFSGEFKVELAMALRRSIWWQGATMKIRPDGFGGYYLYLNFKDKQSYFKKEQTHDARLQSQD